MLLAMNFDLRSILQEAIWTIRLKTRAKMAVREQ